MASFAHVASRSSSQAQRNDRRKSNTPSRTNQGQAPYSKTALPGTKSARQLSEADLHAAVRAVWQHSEQRLRA